MLSYATANPKLKFIYFRRDILRYNLKVTKTSQITILLKWLKLLRIWIIFHVIYLCLFGFFCWQFQESYLVSISF